MVLFGNATELQTYIQSKRDFMSIKAGDLDFHHPTNFKINVTVLSQLSGLVGNKGLKM